MQVVHEILEAHEVFPSSVRIEALTINDRPATPADLSAAVDTAAASPPRPILRRPASRSVSPSPPSPTKGARGASSPGTTAKKGAAAGAAVAERDCAADMRVAFQFSTVPVLQSTRMHTLLDAVFEHVISVLSDPAAYESWKVRPSLHAVIDSNS